MGYSKVMEETTPEELMKTYKSDPNFFFKNVLNCDMWEKQLEIVNKVKYNKRVAVRSANTCGKTYMAARLALWFLVSNKNSIVITIAPTFAQVKNVLWREIHTAYNGAGFPLGGELNQTELNISSNWYARGVGYREGKDPAETIAGYHADNILFIVDEASGVAPKIFEAIEGSLNTDNARLLMIGNPLRNSGDFADAFKSPLFVKMKISAYDTPNVKEGKKIVPGLVEKEGVEEMIRKYGAESDIIRTRVHGDFPVLDTDTKIPQILVEEAQQRDKPLEDSIDEVIGLDPAHMGGDATAFVYRKGYFAKVLKIMYKTSTMEVVGEARRILTREYPRAFMYVDNIGIGAGVCDRLMEMNRIQARVFGVNVAKAATDSEHYINLRAEGWDRCKEWLEYAKLERHESWGELSNPRYKLNSLGKEQIESKEEMKRRGVQSPNVADALILTLLEPTLGATVSPIFL